MFLLNLFRPHPNRWALLTVGGLLATALAGCSYLPSRDEVFGPITPYRVEIVQGNVVTSEMIATIKPGMSRLQVKDALGTPLLADIFHNDRWDYVFTIRRRGTDPQRISIVLAFSGDQLQSVQAPELPSEQDFIASISPAKRVSKRMLALSEEERRALPPPRPGDPPTAEAFRPEREFPALEDTAQIRISRPPPESSAEPPAPASAPSPAS